MQGRRPRHSLFPASDSLLFTFSPGEVPDTREALLSAFKRLDNDISLEAQVGTAADATVDRHLVTLPALL